MSTLQENDVFLLLEDLPNIQGDKYLEDLLGDYAAVQEEGIKVNDFTNIDDIGNSNTAKKRKRRNSSSLVNSNNESGNSIIVDSKKVMHREVERQRRQEMAGLYSSLRNLLPLEFIKGKRAVSDHMDEAVKFIKYMQAKNNAMRTQRDEIKNVIRSSSGGAKDGDKRSNINSDYSSNSCVKVNLFGDQVEILISGGEGFNLSTVLLELMGKGLNVVSCLSNRVNDFQSSLHKIQIQRSNFTYDDLSQLQQRLANVINVA